MMCCNFSHTISGVSFIMQLKCPSGHSRLKHGLHLMSSLMTCACPDSGGVNRGLLEPNSASMGRSSAAARCIRPESLLMTSLAQESSAMASPRSVLPHRLRHVRIAQRDDLVRHLLVLGGADQPYRIAMLLQALRDSAK